MSIFSRFSEVFKTRDEKLENRTRDDLSALHSLISNTKESLYDLPLQPSTLLTSNPDPVVSRKGYDTYDKMMGDPVISSLTEIAVIGMLPSWNITPGGPNGTGGKGADFIIRELENMQGSVLDLFHDEMIEPTFRKGFIVGEAAWDVRKDGSAHLVDFLHRPHNTIKFVRNAHGRVVDIVQETADGPIPFPASRTVHLNYKGGRRNPYGRAGYYPIYDPWMDKIDWMLAWAVFLKRYGPALAMAKVPKAKYDDGSEMIKLMTILENIQRNNVGIIPDWLDIQYETTSGGAGALYSRAVNQRNAEITRGLVGTDTAVAEAIRVGARADTEGKTETMWRVLHVRGAKIREQIKEQFFRPLVRWNMPGEPTPNLDTEEAQPFDVKGKIETWMKGAKDQFLPQPTAEQQIHMLAEMGVDVQEQMAINLSSRTPLKAATGARRKRYLKQRNDNIKRVDAATEELVETYRENAGPALENLVKTFFPGGKFKTHQRIKQADGSSKETALSPSWYRGNIVIKGKQAVHDKLFDLAWEARGRGQTEAATNIGIKATSALGTVALSDTTAQGLLRNDLYYTLQQTYGVLEKDIWFELEQVLKGRSIDREAVNNIRQILYNNRLSDPLGGVTTLVRTSLATAYNDGRDMLYARHESLDPSTTDPGVIKGYEVYATLDDDTTDECEAIHGMCFLVNDPDMPYFPRHPNCRTDKFPIFGDEEPTSGHWLSDSERSKVRAHPPAKGFGGPAGLVRTWR